MSIKSKNLVFWQFSTFLELSMDFCLCQKTNWFNFRSICTYGRARTCVLSVGLAAFLYNIPRFMEVTWDSSFLNESSKDMSEPLKDAVDVELNQDFLNFTEIE